MQNVFVRINEKQFGPLSRSEIRNLVKKGEFKQSDLVWDDEDGDWAEAGQIEALQALFGKSKPKHVEKKIITVGGGKGGVGKTIMTASLGVGLAAMGYEVVLVDADFGGANLHTAMGVVDPEYTFLDYYAMQRDSLEDILLPTPIKNLQIISGAGGTLGMANPKYSQKLRLLEELRTIEADFIILDLGAGSSFTVIDFFLAVNEGVLVTTPEPTAVQETFDFLKICLMRKLHRTFKDAPDILAALELNGVDNLSQLPVPVSKLQDRIREIDPNASAILETVLEEFRPKLILNQVMKDEEIKEGLALKTAAAELLSIDLDYLGYIHHDNGIRNSVNGLRPFIIDNPRSQAAQDLAKIISVKLLNTKGFESFRNRLKIHKGIRQKAEEYLPAETKKSNVICSVNCFYWGECEFQQGGHPCPVRHFDPIFK